MSIIYVRNNVKEVQELGDVYYMALIGGEWVRFDSLKAAIKKSENN